MESNRSKAKLEAKKSPAKMRSSFLLLMSGAIELFLQPYLVRVEPDSQLLLPMFR